MNTKITGAFSLALEIEGLLQLALNRGEMLPAEALPLLKSKADDLCAMINSVTVDDLAAETIADTLPSQPTAAAPAAPEPTPIAPPVETAPVKIDTEAVVEPTGPAVSRDLTKRMTLNDRFRFRRELFHNSVDEMNQAIDVIESMNSPEDVLEYLTNDLCLDENNIAVVDFISFIESNFNK